MRLGGPIFAKWESPEEWVKAAKALGYRGTFCPVGTDAGGDIVSILALVFAPRIDVVGMVIYSVEAVLWAGICLLGLHFGFRLWLLEKMGRKSSDSACEPSDSALESGQTGHPRRDSG